MSNSDAQSRIDRARAYLEKLPPAISGQRGHAATFRAAIAMAHGFGLSEHESLELLLTSFNPKCQPPWQESELRHKVRDAIDAKHDKPRGHLFERERTTAPTRDWLKKAKEYAASWTPAGPEIAEKLGLPAEALRRVHMVGSALWGRIGGVVTWPEFNGEGQAIGITYRTVAGDKKAMKGSKRGIALSNDWQTVRDGFPLVINEGMSDLATVAHAGFPAVARPSKSVNAAVAAAMLAALIRATAHEDILLVVDADDASEQGNGATIASLLKAELPDCRIRWAAPPNGAKDCRAWFVSRPETEDWSDRGRAFLAAIEPREPPAKPPDEPAKPTTLGNRRQILISTEEHRVNNEVIAELIKDESLYQRNGQLVRIIVVAPDQDGPRISLVPRIEVVSAPTLREITSRWVEFIIRELTEDGPEFKRKHPPMWCVNAVSARGSWPGFRHLVGVLSFPVLRRNGSVLTAPGYDPSSGLHLHWLGDPLSLPERPTRDDAIRALQDLLEVVSDFPFESDVYRASWLAALLTPLARAAFDGPAPLFLVDANVPAAGKGLLLEVISRIVTGNPFPVISYPSGSKDGEEELRKKSRRS